MHIFDFSLVYNAFFQTIFIKLVFLFILHLFIYFTDGHDLPLEFLLINVKKTRKFWSISPHPTHPFHTMPNSPPYKFWATLSNSPVPGHINEATIMLSEGVDLSTWSIHYSTMILCSGGSREGQNGGLVIGILNLSGDRFFRSQSSLT